MKRNSGVTSSYLREMSAVNVWFRHFRLLFFAEKTIPSSRKLKPTLPKSKNFPSSTFHIRADTQEPLQEKHWIVLMVEQAFTQEPTSESSKTAKVKHEVPSAWKARSISYISIWKKLNSRRNVKKTQITPCIRTLPISQSSYKFWNISGDIRP